MVDFIADVAGSHAVKVIDFMRPLKSPKDVEHALVDVVDVAYANVRVWHPRVVSGVDEQSTPVGGGATSWVGRVTPDTTE
jgi:hypothetical protein